MDDPDRFGIRHSPLGPLVGWQVRGRSTGGIAAPFASESHPAEVGGAGGPAYPSSFVNVGLGGGEDLDLGAEVAHGGAEVGRVDGRWGRGQEADALRWLVLRCTGGGSSRSGSGM